MTNDIFHLKIGIKEVWKDVLNFTRYENSGAAFSSFQGSGSALVFLLD